MYFNPFMVLVYSKTIMEILQVLALYSSPISLIELAKTSSEYRNVINSHSILNILRGRYFIPVLTDISHLVSYSASLEYNIPDIVTMLMDMSTCIHTVPTVLCASLIMKRYEISLICIPICLDEISRIIEDNPDTWDDLESYCEIFLHELLESNNAEIYRAFFDNVEQCALQCVFSVDYTYRALHHSYVHYIVTGDKKPYNILSKYIKEEPSTFTEILLTSNNLDFARWMRKNTVLMDNERELLMSCAVVSGHYLIGLLTYSHAKSIIECNNSAVLVYRLKQLDGC